MNTNNNEQIECCICFEQIEAKNNCTTPCGHKFCFVCMMKSLNMNNTCPCCRAVLQEDPDDYEEDEEDEEDYDYDDDDDDDDDMGYHQRNSLATTKKISDQLEKMGYTMEDILSIYLGRADHSKNREYEKYLDKLIIDCDEVVETADSEAEKEHIEKFDMMEEDTHRHNKPMRTILNTDLELHILGL